MEIFKPQVVQFESKEQMYKQAEDLIVTQTLAWEGELGLIRMALAGGKTPLPLYTKLSHNIIMPWQDIELYQTDERYISSKSEDSNQFQISQSLGSETLNNCREVNFFNTDFPIDIAAKEYDNKLESLDGIYFDITVLGIGADGHFASLFPGKHNLEHKEEKVIITQAPENLPVTQRLSLTVESILNSRLIFVLISGEDKKDVVKELLEGHKPATEFPAKFLLAHPSLHILQSEE